VGLGETDGLGDAVGEAEGLGVTADGDGAGDVPGGAGESPAVPATRSRASILLRFASPVGTLAAAAATAGNVHCSSGRIGE
jgi:hypothetical protein